MSDLTLKLTLFLDSLDPMDAERLGAPLFRRFEIGVTLSSTSSAMASKSSSFWLPIGSTSSLISSIGSKDKLLLRARWEKKAKLIATVSCASTCGRSFGKYI